jgi:Glutathione S-transferase, N-terminal domain
LFQPVRSIMSDAITLYHAQASPNSRRVRMFLAEKGISLPLVSVDLAGESNMATPIATLILAASCRLLCSKMARQSAKSWPSGAI